MKHKNFFKRVYGIVKQIPQGKVMTYGQLAKMVGTRDARKIGWALHANRDPEVPCHRVVNKDGRLAPNFVFEGAREQRQRLAEEGVAFTDEMHVNLETYGWKHN